MSQRFAAAGPGAGIWRTFGLATLFPEDWGDVAAFEAMFRAHADGLSTR